MIVDENMCRVIADIEYLIGSECYNPHSYDYWSGIEGCGFRYPVHIPGRNGNYYKSRGNLSQAHPNLITPKTIWFIKYKFGANELGIGKGIIDALNYLEDRYELDFNELEILHDLE